MRHPLDATSRAAERRMSVKKYHVAVGDGKGYYGIGYESYREAIELLKIAQSHDPQAHIVEEEDHFTNADRIRAMSDEELADFLTKENWICDKYAVCKKCPRYIADCCLPIGEWLQAPAEGGKHGQEET